MRYNIRRMTEADIDNVYAIEKEVHIAPWSRDILSDCVRVGYDCRVLEIDTDNTPVVGGYVISRYSNNSCHILNFCIAKPLQSQGYGRKFLHDVLSSIAQMEFLEEAVLEVRPSNTTALHLYKSMGFEPTEIKVAYYNDGKNVEDAIFLRKILRT